ncbi:hypothetical protein [Mucilaginibacter sp.]
MLPEESEEPDRLRVLKHDIKNQLSNMYLAIDQLRYELTACDVGAYASFCIDTIEGSCQAINQQLENFK